MLVGGGSYRLHRNGREASKLVLLHGAARFQLVLISQWTVATILGFIYGFCHIFQGYSNNHLHFLHIKHCSNSFAIKLRRKSVDVSPKSFFRTSKHLFAIHFLLATCNVCPLTIPEFFAQVRVSDYWQIIHCLLYCHASRSLCKH